MEKNGKHVKDIIGLDGEKLPGKKLLEPIIKKGKLVHKLPTLKQVGDFYRKEKRKFDPRLFNVNKKFSYPVKISDKLQQLAEQTRTEIERAHHYDTNL